MDRRPLGDSGLDVTPIAYGAFKIGRNEGTKYPAGYELPSDLEAAELLKGILDLGIGLVDTAPAYGCSEQRIGDVLGPCRSEFLLSTKVGEIREDGVSRYDFSPEHVEHSLQCSLQRLQTDHVDLLLVHSDGRDLEIQSDPLFLQAMQAQKERGLARTIGFSGKTTEGISRALDWSDVVMVEYHLEDRSMEDAIRAAADRGVGVLVKKGLGSGRLDAEAALHFLLHESPVADAIGSVVIGSLSLDRMARNIQLAAGA